MVKSRPWRAYLAALVLGDALLLGLAFALAIQLRRAEDLLPVQANFTPTHYEQLAVAVIVGLLVLFWLRGAYSSRILLIGPEEYARIAGGCTYGVVLVVALSYLQGGGPAMVSRSFLLFFWVLAMAGVAAGRFSLRRLAQAQRRRGRFIRRAVIVGVSDQSLAIAQQLHGPAEGGIEVVGFLDDFLPVGTPVAAPTVGGPADLSVRRTFPVLGHPREMNLIAGEHAIELLIVVPTALSWDSQQMLAQLSSLARPGLELRIAPTAYDLTAGGVEPAPLGYIPLLRLLPARIVGIDAVLRGLVDYCLAASLTVLAAPFLAVLLAAARVRGVSPLFERRPVLGAGGIPITLWLLSPAVSDQVIFHGLPALWSVLRGQLGLVGPRPILVAEEAAYRPWAGLLIAMKPGLTGPWRLIAAAGTREEQVLADVWWIRNWNIWRHLFVLFQTAQTVWARTIGRWASGDQPEKKAESDRRASPGRRLGSQQESIT